MTHRSRRSAVARVATFVVVSAAVGLVVSGCSSTSTSPPLVPSSAAGSAAASPPASATGSGPVQVLYAGSLLNLMEKTVGPAYDAATGYTFQGQGAGSGALATLIKGKTIRADVFVSASPKVDATLEGTANGDWVSWYAKFASSDLVLGVNPKSTFAAALRSKPWYDVVGQKGFALGSTDALTDPKGALSVEALRNAATSEKKPELTALAKSFDNVQPEQSLVGRLQAGQLDAAFFYASEAKAAGISTVPLTGQHLKATYTITELRGAPNPKGAEAFIAYLLGPAGQKQLTSFGYDLISPATVTGSGVPASLQSLLGT